MQRCLFFFILISISWVARAQVALNIYSKEFSQQTALARLVNASKLPKQVVDSVSGLRECRRLLLNLYEQGYLAGTFDRIYLSPGKFNAEVNIGKQYKWAQLQTSINKGILNDAGIRLSLLEKKSVSPSSVSTIVKRLLQWYNDNGYPFAVFQLRRVELSEEKVNAELFIDEGVLTTFDSLIVKGNAKLSVVYLSNYLSLRKYDLYNENKIAKIETRLREIPFVNSVRSPEVEFSENKARTIIYIDSKKASQFNGIVGILPDNNNKGKVKVAGDIRLRLLNSFGHAELLDVNWSNPLPKTQDLKIKLNYPFLFDAPFGLDADITLFKKDTTFLEFNRELGIQYFFQGGNYMKVFAGRKTSNLISAKGLENLTTLPPYADVSVNTYGIGWRMEKLDYRLNPRKGYFIEMQVGAGNKIISRNSRINESVYDSIDLKTAHYNGKGSADIYIPLAKRGVFNLGVGGGWLYSPDIFDNELFRFGGLKTLRGFDEQSINASQYIIAETEYRYILEQNSYLFLFVNAAYYENRSRNKFIHDTPVGFGAGMTFETKLGIFSFNYALGKQFDNPILFRNGKIHFGLVNYF